MIYFALYIPHNMRRYIHLLATAFLILSASSCIKSFDVKCPEGVVMDTYTFAVKDADTLRLDVYKDSSWTTPHPTVVYSFGGGWRTGSRKSCMWAGRFVKQGYTFVSIDYRKTITDAKTISDSLNFATLYDTAMKLAIEDLFDATSYMVANAAELCIDPTQIVISGASAGAINSATAEWMICNGDPMATERLPEGFNYAGVIAMAGAVWKYGEDLPEYKTKPCPHMFIHGSADTTVPYELMPYPQCNYYGFGPGILKNIYKENGWPFYEFVVEDADHYMCCGPDVKCFLPSENVDYTRVVFDYLERSVHEYLPLSIEYYEKDLDGARTWDRLKKSWAKVAFSRKLKKQICALPEFGSGNVEKQTFDFAIKDGDTLRMDIFRDPSFSGKRPVLLYSFGGGWESGNRFFIENSVYPLADQMAKMGFVVVSYDYRLLYRKAKKEGIVPNIPIATYLMEGNKETKDTVAIETMLASVEIAVEDLYDATSFIVEHADEFSIDTKKIIIMGGSAGAFNCLQAEYWLCNEMPIAKAHLPEGFRYAGLVPCAGAIFHKTDEPIVWKKNPAPILFYHGNVDRCVKYTEFSFANYNLTCSGSAVIADGLDEIGASYILYTSKDRDHEMAGLPAGYMDQFTVSFIDRLVFNGEKIQARVVETWDPSVDNPNLFYLQRALRYPWESIIHDYFNYIVNAWD